MSLPNKSVKTSTKEQKSLYGVDASACEENPIISCLSEPDIEVADGVYHNDDEETAALFRNIGARLPPGYTLQQLGNPSDRYARTLEMCVSRYY